MNIPIYEKEGFEADDCIGTVVEKLKNKEIEIYIVSGDKDIFQLINGKVKVYSLRKGLSQMQIVDHQTIESEYNLQPADFIDLKALAGDSSDNIPGVPKIGPKTATELLQKFDTLKNLYKNLDSPEVKPRIKKLLEENKEQAFLSQKLATIHRDVPIEFSLEECKWGEYDKGELIEFFEELGFESLLRRFGMAEIETKKGPSEEQKKKDQQLKLL
jgi:DNA polymerase-1